MKGSRTLVVLAGIALGLLGAVAWAEWRDATTAPALADRVAHTRDAQISLNELLSRVEDIDDGARAFVLTGDPAFLAAFSASVTTAQHQLQVVRTLTRDNPVQQAHCDAVAGLLARKIATAQTEVDLRRDAGFEAARRMVIGDTGDVVMDQIRARIAAMHAEQRTVLGRRRAAVSDQRRRARTWRAIESSLSFLLLIAAFVVVWRESGLRRQAEQRLHELNAQLEQRVRAQTAALEHAARLSREAADRFRIIVEGVTDYAILMLDPRGHVITWNPGAERLKGYREEEIVGQHFSRFYPAEDVARGKPAMELDQAAASGRFEDEGWRVRKDGTRFWASVIITALHDEAGRLRGFVKVTHDLTAREQVEKALRDSEQFLAQSQRLAHLGNWMVDLETGAHKWSDELCRICGVSPDDFVPTRDALLALVHPDDRPTLRSQMDALDSGQHPPPAEFRVVRPDGTIRVVEGTGEVEVNTGGKPIRLIGTAQDITERRQTEQALRRSSVLLDQTGQVAKVGGWELDLDTQTLRWTKETYRIHEVDPAIQPSLAEAIQFYGPDARPVITAAVQGAIDAGTPFDLELPLVTAQGRCIWVRAQGTAERHGGRSTRLYGAFQDVTQQRLAEESLRLQSAALQAAADAIVITDRAGIIEWVNPAFTALTGYAAEEALGKDSRDLVKSGKHTAEFFKDFWETILAGETWRGEIINRRKDGTLHTEDQIVAPIFDASGVITHFVAIKKDITARLRLEAQFRQAQKMESVGQLASGIAHDFNNLLTVINGMSELVLARVGHDDPVFPDVQEVHRAGERAAALTRQLLAFSRQQVLEPRVLNVNTVLDGMEPLLRRLLGEDIDLVIVPAPDLASVKADPGQIEQVITNLAVNARDAMPQGGRLTIESQNVEVGEDYARQHGAPVPPGAYVRLVVSDSGVGMSEATRARIFEPFFTTKGPGRGTGLGLSTAFGIVKQSQGFIWVYSEVGVGTSFTILLPQEVPDAAGSAPAKATPVSSRGTETILVVEDNAGLRKLARRFLDPAGYTVLLAATGEEALRVVARQDAPVHLLLSDVVMPGMSGRQLAERLAPICPAMKVLYMSGYTDDTIVRHGVLDATVPFLNKPFTAAALLSKVREVLDS